MGFPKILHDNRLDDATPVASTTAAGDYNVLNLRDWLPYTWWKPTALPATVTVDCGVARAADYALIYGHNLHDSQAAIEIRGSTDNFVSSDILVSVTNALAYPEQFDHAAWFKDSTTVVANSAADPKGGFAADTVSGFAAGNQRIGQTVAFLGTANKTYTFSVYLAGSGTINIQLSNNVDDAVSSAIQLTSTLTRYSVTKTFNSTVSSPTVYIHSPAGMTATSCTVWGAQLKFGAESGYYEGIGNDPLLLQLSSASYRYWRKRVVSLSGVAIPSLAIAAIGTALEIPAYLSSGFDPLGRKVIGQSNRSEGGQPLGRVIDFEEWREKLRFENVGWDWLRSSFNPAWAAHLRSEPFGFCWDAESYADEVRLVQAGSDYKTPHHPGALADLNLEVTGVI